MTRLDALLAMTCAAVVAWGVCGVQKAGAAAVAPPPPPVATGTPLDPATSRYSASYSRAYDAADPNEFYPAEYQPERWKRWLVIAPVIAACESGSDPTRMNRDGSGATGWLQLMPVHERRANRLNWQWGDMLTLEGNRAVGFSLYLEQGLAPWRWSQSCWGPKLPDGVSGQ